MSRHDENIRKASIGLSSLAVFLTMAISSYFIAKPLQKKNILETELNFFNPNSIQDERVGNIDSLKKIIELEPDNWTNYFELGKTYNTLEQYPSAIVALQKSLQLAEINKADKTSLYNILVELSQALAKNGNLNEALKVLERARQIFPTQPVAYNGKGKIYDRKKQSTKAKAEYLKAQQVDKKDAEAYKNLSDLDLKKNKKKSAFEYLLSAVRNNPNNFKAFENLADAYSSIKDPIKAISSYQRALELNPPKKNKIGLYYKLAQAYKQKGDILNHDKNIIIGDSFGLTDSKITESLGDILAKNDIKGALKAYRRSLSANKNNPSLLRKYNELYNIYASDLKKTLDSSNVGAGSANGSNNGTGSANSSNGGLGSANSSNVGVGSANGSNVGLGSANSSNVGVGSANSSNVGVGSANGSNVGVGSANGSNNGVGSANGSNNGVGSANGSNVGVGSANGSNVGVGSANGSNIGAGSANSSNGGDKKVDVESLLSEGKKAFEEKKYDLSYQKFIQARTQAPDNNEIPYFLARTLDKQGKDKEAVENYKIANEQDPNNKKSFYYLGLVYYRQEKYSLALSAFKQSVVIDPNYVNAHYSLGLSASKLGDESTAIKSYLTAIGIDPKLYEPYFNLAISYKKINKLDSALEEIEKAFKIKQNDAALYYQKGEIYEKKGNITLAKENYEQAVQMDPNFHDAQFNLALLYSKEKNFAKATQLLQTIQETKTNDPTLLYQLGHIQEEQGNNDEAIDYYEKAIRSNQSYTSAYLNLGNVYAKKGVLSKAIDAYTDVLHLDPKHFEAILNLGNLYTRAHNYTEAKVYYEKAIGLKPEFIDLKISYSEVLEELQLYDKAQKQYAFILNNKPNHKIALEKLAFLYYRKLNDKIHAKEIFKKILALYPQHPQRSNFEKILSLLE